MSLIGLTQQEVSDFRGPMTPPLVETSDIPPDVLTVAENVTFGPGYVRTREGHEALFTPSAPISSFYNWTASGNNRLVYATQSGVGFRELASGVDTALGSVSSIFQNFQEAGSRIYCTFASSSGAGCSEARVWNGDYTGTVGSQVPAFYKICPGPLTTAPTVTESAVAGTCTAGVHRFGYILTSKTGYMGKPYQGHVEATLAGGKLVNFSITFPTTPTWVDKLTITMTTKDNLALFRTVPAAVYSVAPGGTNVTINAIIDISDSALTAGGKDITDNNLLLTQDSSGVGPIQPFTCLAYGNRMVYVTKDTLYISNPNDFESLAQDQNAVQLPAQQEITAVGEVNGMLIVFGKNYAYSLTDTGGYPVEWPQPRRISGSIGSPSMYGVSRGNDSGYAWVAGEGGLYTLNGGTFSAAPISKNVTPLWARINWTNPHLVRVYDHSLTQRVFVVAPLDSDSTAKYVFVFGYGRGIETNQITCSLDTITGKSISCLGNVRNASSQRGDIVISTTTSGAILRRRDPKEAMALGDSGYSDNGSFIAARAVTSQIPQLPNHFPAHVRAFSLNITGNCTITPTLTTVDSEKSIPLAPISLASSQAYPVIRRVSLIKSRARMEFAADPTSNAWWSLSSITTHYKRWISHY